MDDLTLDGLSGAVEIRRDPHGIPHMRASSIWDGFMAQGYMAGQDRMLQLEFDRRRGLGTWAAVVGQSGVAGDVFARQARLAAAAQRSFEALDPSTREALNCYATGVNAAFSTSPLADGLVTGPDRWAPWHSCLVYQVRHVWMGSLTRKLIRTALLRSLPAELVWRVRANAGEEVPILAPGRKYRSPDPGPTADWGAQLDGWLGSFRPEMSMYGAMGVSGSNSWAASGAKTATGRPMLAGDPHRGLEVPNPYWQNHLVTDEFNVIGLSFPGVPGFPHFGHSQFVAWCITHGCADDQDLFIEQLGEISTRTETIEIADDEAVTLELWESDRGGVIAADKEIGLGVSLRWTALAEPDRTFDCLLPMLTARSCAEFDESMRHWVIPANNLLFADVQGEIRYRLRGRVPLRTPANGWSVVPGWDPAHSWRGWCPFEEMPAVTNPPEGLIVTANNRQQATEAPFISHDFSASSRAQRILERLSTAAELDHDAMKRIHADVISIPATEFVAALDGAGPGEHQRWLERLRGWDGEMSADRPEPAIYSAIRRELCSGLAEAWKLPLPDELVSGVISGAFPAIIAQVRAGDQTVIANWSRSLAQATGRAIEWLTATLGEDEEAWRWGALNHLAFTPAVPGLSVPEGRSVPGDSDTVRMAASGVADTKVVGASVARYVFDVGGWENCAWVIPEQFDEWYQVQLVPMYYEWSAIPEGHGTVRRLVPAHDGSAPARD